MAVKLGVGVAIIFGVLAFMGAGATAAGSKIVTFVFGDSLSEVGNNNYLQYSLARSNFPWYGIDYPGGKATGRFTNGRTIGDIICKLNILIGFNLENESYYKWKKIHFFCLNSKLTHLYELGTAPPPPYLSLSPNDDKILEGVNYASGGAGILNTTGVYFVQRLTFDDQIRIFGKTKAAITTKIGENATTVLLNKAVCFIGMGSNDYVNNYLLFLAFGKKLSHERFVELLVSTLEQQLLELHQFGARKIVFHGLGPLGCIPAQRVKTKTGECITQLNTWVMAFNSAVQKLTANLNAKLPNADFIFADTYPAVYDLISHPTAYGFKIANTSCCNVDSTVSGLCLQNSTLCKDRRDYVFWDAYHPSDAANVVLASKLFESIFPNNPASK